MTLEEYDMQFDKLFEKYKNTKADEDRENLINAQYAYMESVLEPLLDVHNDPETKAVGEIIDFLTYSSTSGSVVHYVDTEEEANRLAEVLEEKVGGLMLDAPQVYYNMYEDNWAVDCMFSGSYCPAWDGIDDED